MIKTQSKTFELLSPGKEIKIDVEVTDHIRYDISYQGKQILAPSPLSLTLEDRKVLGVDSTLTDVNRQTVDDVIRPVVREKNEEITNRYEELRLQFGDQYGVIFRVYDDGIAYRFVTDLGDKKVRVTSEQVQLNFADDYSIYFPEEKNFMTQHEKGYQHLSLSDISRNQFCNTPALVDLAGGPKVLITEADLEDYPGLYLQGTGSPALTGKFPHVPTKEKLETDRDLYITERADYIAETSGSRFFPWRVLAFADTDGELIQNQLVFKLARPSQLKEPSWIRPGKAVWEGWNPFVIYDVDFRAGPNMPTYKYYIDFASRLKLDYVIFEQWYELGNLMNVKPDIDIPELVNYGKKKGVGIILWVVWKTLEDQWDVAFKQFEKWGIRGIKVDFMQHDDQRMVNWYWKVAKETARRKLLVEFHGSYKPTGLRRTYPNVISREAVKGLEQVKGLEHNHPNWGKDITPGHNLTIPFVRMPTGPMDYTPGAMTNARKENFRVNFRRPMSEGTRCHQLAMYVVYESPLQVLADSPSNYLKQKEDILRFLSVVPSTWDETRVLKAKIGGYLLLARRKGDRWFAGAMTDEHERTFRIPLTFLNKDVYTAEIYSDGINTDQYAEDYRYSTEKVTSNSELKVNMKAGGGWVAIFMPYSPQS